MIAALALAVLASTSSAQDYNASIRGNEVTVRVYDLTKIYGPFKFYISPVATPNASASVCATCPQSGVTATNVVTSSMVTQKWAANGRYVDATFSIAAAGGLENFYFTAVTCVPNEERFLMSGVAPMNATR